jgi:hypothetical protein
MINFQSLTISPQERLLNLSIATIVSRLEKNAALHQAAIRDAWHQREYPEIPGGSAQLNDQDLFMATVCLPARVFRGRKGT